MGLKNKGTKAQITTTNINIKIINTLTTDSKIEKVLDNVNSKSFFTTINSGISLPGFIIETTERDGLIL